MENPDTPNGLVLKRKRTEEDGDEDSRISHKPSDHFLSFDTFSAFAEHINQPILIFSWTEQLSSKTQKFHYEWTNNYFESSFGLSLPKAMVSPVEELDKAFPFLAAATTTNLKKNNNNNHHNNQSFSSEARDAASDNNSPYYVPRPKTQKEASYPLGNDHNPGQLFWQLSCECLLSPQSSVEEVFRCTDGRSYKIRFSPFFWNRGANNFNNNNNDNNNKNQERQRAVCCLFSLQSSDNNNNPNHEESNSNGHRNQNWTAEKETRLRWFEYVDRLCPTVAIGYEFDEGMRDFKRLFVNASGVRYLRQTLYRGVRSGNFNVDEAENFVGSYLTKDTKFPQSETDYFIQKTSSLKEIGEKSVDERTIVFPTGEQRVLCPVIQYVEQSPNGEPCYLFLIEDKTELRRVEQALRQKEESLKKSQEQTDILMHFFTYSPFYMGIIELTEDNQDFFYISTNPALASFIGYTSAQLGGMRASETGFLDREELKQTLEFYRQSSERQTPVVFEQVAKTKDGRASYVSVVVSHVRDRKYVFLGLDVSQRKELEEKLKKNSEQLEHMVQARTVELKEALQVKSRFLATMSHEIRTPLLGIMGSLSLLAADGQFTLEQQELLRISATCAEYLLNTIDDILDCMEMEEQKLVIRGDPLNLLNLIEEAMQTVSLDLAKKPIDLVCDIDSSLIKSGLVDDDGYVLGDQRRLKQILIKLLGNSIKFSSNGDIILSISCVPLDLDLLSEVKQVDETNAETMSVSPSKGNQSQVYEITFAVKDQGIGIGQVDQQKIFQHFSQGDTSRSRKFEGVGLGLSISKGLCELMGGRMWFESMEGQGTTFYFTFRTSVVSPAGQSGSTSFLSESFRSHTPVPFIPGGTHNDNNSAIESGRAAKYTFATPDQPVFNDITIMLVDPSRAVTSSLHHLLSWWGFSPVLCYTSAKDAMDHLLRLESEVGMILVDGTQSGSSSIVANLARSQPTLILGTKCKDLIEKAYAQANKESPPIHRNTNTSNNKQDSVIYPLRFINKPIKLKQLYSYLNKHFTQTQARDFQKRNSISSTVIGEPNINNNNSRRDSSSFTPISLASPSSSSPFAPPAAIVGATGSHGLSPQKRDLNILIAEDNIMNQRVLQKMVVSLGYKNVDIAENGKVALDLLQKKRIDLILMDVMMPEMDGIQATEQIRQQITPKQQPFIVAVTADAFEENKRKCLDAGMDEVTTKPIPRNKLQEILARYAQRMTTKEGC